MKLSPGKKAILLIFLILLIDQIVKILVKTNMTLGQEIKVIGNWFLLKFTENNGMAFGWEFGGQTGKLILSIFRLLAICGIGWYLVFLVKTKAHTGYILCISLIFAGAIGNIIDSAFYGIIFSESDFHAAQLFPEGGGYSTFLHGKVVDMLYFPIIKGTIPSWFPFWSSEEFVFFRPIFNLADSSITVGVAIILIFQKKFFKHN